MTVRSQLTVVRCQKVWIWSKSQTFRNRPTFKITPLINYFIEIAKPYKEIFHSCPSSLWRQWHTLDPFCETIHHHLNALVPRLCARRGFFHRTTWLVTLEASLWQQRTTLFPAKRENEFLSRKTDILSCINDKLYRINDLLSCKNYIFREIANFLLKTRYCLLKTTYYFVKTRHWRVLQHIISWKRLTSIVSNKRDIILYKQQIIF